MLGTSSLPSLAAPDGSRANPLAELMQSERDCVDSLSRTIKRVASAWSRSNLPPPDLDAIFRAIEAVYRVNKSFLSKLDAIGPNPSSPKALGDLLMRWTDDLEPPYTRYVTVLHHGFDRLPDVRDNPNLPAILATLPGSPTLDSLFVVPLDRLRYYKSLYTKLLAGSQPGRSDHRLLTAANEKLDSLLRRGDVAVKRPIDVFERPTPQNHSPRAPSPSTQPTESTTRPPSVISHYDEDDLTDPSVSQPSASRPTTSGGDPDANNAPSNPSGFRVLRKGSDRDSDPQHSFESNPTVTTTVTDFSSPTQPSTSHTSASSHTESSLDDLELRLDASDTLDLFSMKPRPCRLQINPPTLNYTRSFRRRADVFFHHIPKSDPNRQRIQYPDAHLVLLTDLFLVCRRVNDAPPSGKDLSLIFPPLSAKHLRVTEAEHDFDDDIDSTVTVSPAQKSSRRLDVTVMKRETLSVTFTSNVEKEAWKVAFDEATTFASNHTLKLKVDNDQSTPRSPSSPTRLNGTPSPSSSTATSPLALRAQSRNRPQHPNSNNNLNSSGRDHSPTAPNGRSPIPNENRDAFDNTGYTNNDKDYLGPSANFDDDLSTALSERFALTSSPVNGIPSGPARSPRVPPLPQGAAPPGPSGPPVPPPIPPGAAGPGPGNGFARPPYPPPPHLAPSKSSYHPPTEPLSTTTTTPPHPNQYGLPPGAPPANHIHPSHMMSRSRSAEACVPQVVEPHGNQHPSLSNGPASTGHGAGGGGWGGYNGYDARSSSAPSSASSSRNPFAYDQRSYGHRSPTPPSPHHHHDPKHWLNDDPMRSSHAAPSVISRSRSNPDGTGWGTRSINGSNHGYDDDDDDDEEFAEAKRSMSPIRMDQSRISAQMRCKVFLKQQHSQWKPLGTGSLTLYVSTKNNMKQLVVESDSNTVGNSGIMASPILNRSSTTSSGSTKPKNVIISTIVLTDGVERVGKTGVAIELSRMDSRSNPRTGIVYMLQMKAEKPANGLFEQLLLGSDRDPSR